MKVLEGRYAVITGANRGLGKAIARAYVEAGANIMICARNNDLLEKTKLELIRSSGNDRQIISRQLDVSNREDVANFIDETLEKFPRIDILVNNAGIYGPKGFSEDVDIDEWEKTFSINLFGLFNVCRAVLPHFKKNGYGKIVNLSGGGATGPLPRFTAYSASKAAVVRLSETMAEEVRGTGIDINLIAPGALNTRMMEEVLAEGPEKVGEEFYNKTLKQKESGGTSLEKGAGLAVYLGSAASDGITGKLISAVWDPWENLHDYLDDIEKSDIYTLRRIVPKDRGAEWGDR